MSDPLTAPEVQAAAVKVMSEWVASIADRFKNPIAGITLALDVLEKALPSDATERPLVDDALARMRERLLALNAYVSELVDFAKPAEIRPLAVELESLVRNVLDDAKLSLPSNATVSCTAEVGLASVRLDPAKFRVVLAALIDNAAQAVPPSRAPEIALSLGRSEVEARPLVRVTVEDNGPGVPAELVEQVFAPFFSTREAGTGLGLAIVHKYVQAHGGQVRIGRSARLGGARFELDLPVVEAEAAR